MDPTAYVNVDFYNVEWSNSHLPRDFSKLVKCNFLLDANGSFAPHDDLKDILEAWLQDEFMSCPKSFDFQIAL